ncbi:MAG: VOC family protein [Candidatus Saccharimonadales bacterium]
MQKITPNLWCDGNAREMADFYLSIFPSSKITGGSKYPANASEGLADFQLELAGKDLTIDLKLAGHDFTLINAGPEFKPTAANSFFVNFNSKEDPEARQHLEHVWEKLAEGGAVLMELQKYPFSDYYGWVQDKYGYSWQLMLLEPQVEFACIMPGLLFANGVQNKAQEALEFYSSVFKGSQVGYVSKYQEDTGPAKADVSVAYGDVELAPREWFAVMDSGIEQNVTFNEAVSYVITCKDQQEVDYFWEKLSSVSESEQCGWCKDRYGVSWQIVPENMGELMQKPNAFKTLMSQHKIVIAEY